MIHSSTVRSSWARVSRCAGLPSSLVPSANLPSSSHASTTITVPVIVIASDDVCARANRPSTRTPCVGFCSTGCAPAPSAPIAISTAPVAPNQRMWRTWISSRWTRAGPSDSVPCRTATVVAPIGGASKPSARRPHPTSRRPAARPRSTNAPSAGVSSDVGAVTVRSLNAGRSCERHAQDKNQARLLFFRADVILAAWPTSHRSSRTSPPRAPTSTASSPTCPPRNGRPRPRPPAGASRIRSHTSPGPTMPPSRPRPTPAGSPTSCAPRGRTPRVRRRGRRGGCACAGPARAVARRPRRPRGSARRRRTRTASSTGSARR